MKTGDLRNPGRGAGAPAESWLQPSVLQAVPVPVPVTVPVPVLVPCALCCLLQETDPSDGTSDERPGPGPCPVCVWSLALLDTKNTALSACKFKESSSTPAVLTVGFRGSTALKWEPGRLPVGDMDRQRTARAAPFHPSKSVCKHKSTAFLFCSS